MARCYGERRGRVRADLKSDVGCGGKFGRHPPVAGLGELVGSFWNSLLLLLVFAAQHGKEDYLIPARQIYMNQFLSLEPGCRTYVLKAVRSLSFLFETYIDILSQKEGSTIAYPVSNHSYYYDQS